MPSLSKIKQVTEIALQDYPVTSARYRAGDPTVTAQLNAIQHMLAEIGRDIEISELEPFRKSREATILADASNKGILPIGTPCQHILRVTNKGQFRVTLESGRVIEDGQGRPWRLLQTVEIFGEGYVDVLVEQSKARKIKRTIIETMPFYQFTVPIEDDMSMVKISVVDQEQNAYSFITRWMNVSAGDYAITLSTNSLREITLEFGDSSRFGRTLEANTELEIEILETYGDIDATTLKEAMLQEVNSSQEASLQMKFLSDGLVKMGANPLSIDQMRLLASYPTHDDNAVFLGNFDFLVRKKFMARCHYINVWNETIHEQYFGADIRNINHLFVCFVPKNSAEYNAMKDEIRQFIGHLDSLYSNEKTVFYDVEERPLNMHITATLSSVHDVDVVKEQIITLLVSHYGKQKIATSYNIESGFNLQEISKLFNKNIPAFQDRQSDFNISIENLSLQKIKPNQWLYLRRENIQININRLNGEGGGLWAVY